MSQANCLSFTQAVDLKCTDATSRYCTLFNRISTLSIFLLYLCNVRIGRHAKTLFYLMRALQSYQMANILVSDWQDAQTLTLRMFCLRNFVPSLRSIKKELKNRLSHEVYEQIRFLQVRHIHVGSNIANQAKNLLITFANKTTMTDTTSLAEQLIKPEHSIVFSPVWLVLILSSSSDSHARWR